MNSVTTEQSHALGRWIQYLTVTSVFKSSKLDLSLVCSEYGEHAPINTKAQVFHSIFVDTSLKNRSQIQILSTSTSVFALKTYVMIWFMIAV